MKRSTCSALSHREMGSVQYRKCMQCMGSSCVCFMVKVNAGDVYVMALSSRQGAHLVGIPPGPHNQWWWWCAPFCMYMFVCHACNIHVALHRMTHYKIECIVCSCPYYKSQSHSEYNRHSWNNIFYSVSVCAITSWHLHPLLPPPPLYVVLYFSIYIYHTHSKWRYTLAFVSSHHTSQSC